MRERERGRGMPAYCWHGERRMPQMLDVSVCGGDKALHKFGSGFGRRNLGIRTVARQWR